jgi:SAM-dependent methyltransferase
MRLDPAYTRYAEVYDQIGQRRFGEGLARLTLAWLAERGATPGTAVDLACGTGAAASVLAQAGLRVWGVDRSDSMLAVAAGAPAAGASIVWLSQDICHLELPEPVELATCFYDSVNYLRSERELAALFHGVARVLFPSGWLVFDVNTRRRLAEGWDRTTMVAADDERAFVVYRSWFDEPSGISPLIITGFLRNDAGSWDRFDEEHVERAFALDNIDQLLAEAGFDVVHRFEHLPTTSALRAPGTEASDRVVFFARRAQDSVPE